MALLPILTQEAPVLRQKAKRVTRVDDSIRKLIDDMVETMVAAPGVGLAANQVGVALRVIVVKTDANLYSLVNPEMVKATGEQVGLEGCLFIDRLTSLDTLRKVEPENVTEGELVGA